MSIRQIKEQLLKYERLTISELATVLKEPEDGIQFIVDEWVTKGKIIGEKEEPICMSGGCGCSSGTADSCSAVKIHYSWVS